MMDIILFGTGDYYMKYKKWFKNHRILALFDNDERKQDQFLDGIKIVSPTKVLKYHFEAIFLLSVNDVDMRKQLLRLGVNDDSIFSYYDIVEGLNGELFHNHMYVYGEDLLKSNTSIKKRILFITHNMDVTGAEIVLLEAANILRNNGYDVVVATLDDGNMRSKFTDDGFPVIYDESLKIARLENIPWIKKITPSYILVNTVFIWHLLRCSNVKIPVLWWLHDSEMLYAPHFCRDLDKFRNSNVHVYAVSDVAKSPFLKRCLGWDVRLLPFGIEDTNGGIPKTVSSKKIIFAVIGTLEKRKAQDVFLRAILKLSHEIREKSEFWLIYQNPRKTPYLEKVERMSMEIKEVKLLGFLNREEMNRIYEEISVLVCPSLSDTLPVVTIEALQHYVPCIVSDETGTATFIKDYSSGFICKTNDVDDLVSKMSWMVTNEDKISNMGMKAREIYEKYFTKDIFEKNMLEAIN